MSLSPQGYSTSNVYEAIASMWQPRMQALDLSDVEQFTRFHTDDAAAIRRWSDLPIGRLATWANGSTPITTQVVGSTGQTVTYTPDYFALKVAINDFDVQHNPQIVQQKVAELESSVRKLIKSLIYDALNGGFTATYPDGSGAATTQPIYTTQNHYASAGDADGVLDQHQSNYLEAGLDYSGLNSAMNLMQNFKDASGEPIGLGRSGLCLIVPTELRSTAVNLVGPEFLGGTSTSTVNPNNSSQISVISSAYLSDHDINNWFLCETAAGGMTPVNLWTSGVPTLHIDKDPSNLQTTITAAAYMKAWVDGPAAGIVASQVA